MTGAAPQSSASHLPTQARHLFVYGTLRRGGSNDIARLVPEAVFIANASMRGTLFDLGDYPAMLVDGRAGWIVGEIYAIPDAGWPALDALEETVTPERPDGYYFRVIAEARLGDATFVPCEVYVANPATLRLVRQIDDGDWMAHATRIPR